MKIAVMAGTPIDSKLGAGLLNSYGYDDVVLVPISNKEELLTETVYSLKYFYTFPSLLVILPVVAYGILIQENVFLFPVSYVSNGETIFISATQGILISIGYPSSDIFFVLLPIS